MNDLQTLKQLAAAHAGSGKTMGEIRQMAQQQEVQSKILEALSRPQQQATITPTVVNMPEIQVPPAQVVINQAPRTAWTFTFARSADGLIQSITATPA